jgi:16S rRNA (uracil1498-N3)-methyltransferase
MNLLLLFPDDFERGPPGAEDREVHVARVEGRRAHHVREVLRAKRGDRLVVGLIDERVGSAVIDSLEPTALQLRVTLDRQPPEPLPLSLILALPRPLVLKRVLIAATSMGVKRIVLINPRRVDKSFWSSTAVRDDAIFEQLVLGLEQARDTRLPEVWKRPHFRSFVEEELGELTKGGASLIAHPGPTTLCGSKRAERPLHLAIGPVGGFAV